LPKAAQIFAARRVGSDVGEFRVFGGHLAMQVTAASCLQKTGSGDHRHRPSKISLW
jgi:hypothetical protein